MLPLLEETFGFGDSLALLYLCNSSSPLNSTATPCNTSPAILSLIQPASGPASSPSQNPISAAYGLGIAVGVILILFLTLIGLRHLYIRRNAHKQPSLQRRMENDIGMGSFAVRPPPPRAPTDAFWGSGPPPTEAAAYVPGSYLVGSGGGGGGGLPAHVVAASRAAEERVRDSILQSQAARQAQGDASWSTRV